MHFFILFLLGTALATAWNMLEKRCQKPDPTLGGRLVSRGPVQLINWQEHNKELQRLKEESQDARAAADTRQFKLEQARAKARLDQTMASLYATPRAKVAAPIPVKKIDKS